MLLEWKKVESFNEPVEVDYCSSPNTVFLHKNIEEQKFRDDTENEYIKYLYDEAVITNPHFIYPDVSTSAEYCSILLSKAKNQKLEKLQKALEDKHQNKNSTLTFELPATLRKGDETKNVTNYKLLTVTSAGLLSTVLMGLNMLASSLDVPDSLVTDDGYTIVGLNQSLTIGDMTAKQIAFIFAKYTEITGKITETFRMTKEMILNAGSYEELEAITISFDDI